MWKFPGQLFFRIHPDDWWKSSNLPVDEVLHSYSDGIHWFDHIKYFILIKKWHDEPQTVKKSNTFCFVFLHQLSRPFCFWRTLQHNRIVWEKIDFKLLSNFFSVNIFVRMSPFVLMLFSILQKLLNNTAQKLFTCWKSQCICSTSTTSFWCLYC